MQPTPPPSPWWMRLAALAARVVGLPPRGFAGEMSLSSEPGFPERGRLAGGSLDGFLFFLDGGELAREALTSFGQFPADDTRL